MSKLRDGRVVGPSVHAPSTNPFFRDAPEACAGPSSASASLSSADTFAEDRLTKNLRHYVLALDQVSFLTGCPSPNLQAAHLLNTVRGHPDLKQRVVCCHFRPMKVLKQSEQENRLTKLQIVEIGFYPAFQLDSVYNCILLEASLHQDFDKTASFVLLPKLPQLHAISRKLKDSNADWQARTQEFGDVARLLKVNEAPFIDIDWTVFIPLASRFLPCNYPLAIAQTVHLSSSPDASIQPFAGDWQFYTCSASSSVHRHSLVSCSNVDSPLLPFRHRTTRTPAHQVNTLAMLLAAQQRLSYWKGQATRLEISSDVLAMSTLLDDITEGVYFVPVPAPGSKGEINQRRNQEAVDLARHQEARSRSQKRKLEPDADDLTAVDTPPTAPAPTNQRGLTEGETDTLCDILDHSTDARERMKAGQMLFFGVPTYGDSDQDDE